MPQISQVPGEGPQLQCGADAESEGDVMLEFELPFWIEEGDVDVQITETSLTVAVRNELDFQRTYWRNRFANTNRRPHTHLPHCRRF